jgi:hypothetical protein
LRRLDWLKICADNIDFGSLAQAVERLKSAI